MIKKALTVGMLSSLLNSCGFSDVEHNSLTSEKNEMDKISPEKGYEILVNDDYIGCGIPVNVMKRVFKALDFMPQQIKDSFFPLVTKQPFMKADIPGRKGLNKDLNVVYNSFRTKRGVDAIYLNCLSCHSEKFDGKTVVGLGNTTWDYTQDMSIAVPMLSLFAETDAEKKEIEIFQRTITPIAKYIKTNTIGVNPAINLTYALFLNRDIKDGEWVKDNGLTPPQTDFPPVDVPPWWRVGLKNSMFYNGEFQNKHNFVMSLASLMCQDSGQDIVNLYEKFKHVEAYVKNLKAPKYTKFINVELAKSGQTIFNQNCSQCHGTYDAGKIIYQEKFIPLQVIKTDPWLSESQNGIESLRFREFGKKFYQNLFNEDIQITPRPGYIAPSLNGIWITAPYFHNGSVPTIEGVLNSKVRPKYWTRKEGYDTENMSVYYDELMFGKAFTPLLLKRYVYDTTLKGYSNKGHYFGDRLSEIQRKAVIEYLKTL